MSNRLRRLILVMAALLLSSSLAASNNPGNTAWFQGSLEQALDFAKKQNRPVFVFFSAHWCVPCLALKSELFPRADFEELMKTKFVPYYMDYDAPGSQGWMDKLKVEFIPQMVVLSPDGQEVLRISPAATPQKIVEALQGGAAIKRSFESMAEDAVAGKPLVLSDEEWKLLADRVSTGVPLLKTQEDSMKALRGFYTGIAGEKKETRAKLLIAYLNTLQRFAAGATGEAQSFRKDFDALFEQLKDGNYPQIDIGLIDLILKKPEEKKKYQEKLIAAFAKWRAEHEGDKSFEIMQKRLSSWDAAQTVIEASGKPPSPSESSALLKSLNYELSLLSSLKPMERDVIALSIANLLLSAKLYDKAKSVAQNEIDRNSDQKDKFVGLLASIAEDKGDKQGSKKLRFDAYDLVPGRSSKLSRAAGILNDAIKLNMTSSEISSTIERALADFFKESDSVEGWDTFGVTRILKTAFEYKGKPDIDWPALRVRVEKSTCRGQSNCIAIARNIGVSANLPKMAVKQVVNMSVALYEATHLGVYFENNPGWHTYAKKADQITLPMSISTHSGTKVIAADAIEGWPATVEFIGADGLKGTGYSGRYGFFITLSKPLREMLASENGVRVEVKWLACKDICIPGTSSVTAKLDKFGALTSEPLGFGVTKAEAAQWFSKTTAVTDWPAGPASEGFGNLLIILALALLGGFILNFMPCVLPVISIKLFSLMKHRSQSRAVITKHSLAYTAGVLVSFFALAIGVILLKMTGASVGWGFQLQSPLFVAGMILVLFVMMLSFFGLFEFKALGANYLVGKLDGAERSEKISATAGSFGNGLLATLLATPCSAPFLGTALAFAFLASAPLIILIFLFVGIGLSAPFLVIAAFPSLLRVLPKPGAWMENLSRILGVFLGITLVWLIDVYTSLSVGADRAFWLSLTLLFAFFAIYGWQRMAKGFVGRVLLVALFVASLIPLAQSLNETGTPSLLTWQKWSPEAQAKAVQGGSKVFVDFTAEWCITCKYNEKVFLETSAFADLVKKENIVLMKADFTRPDKEIADFLHAHGKPGVPAYFVQTPKDGLIDLGSLLTLGILEDALRSQAPVKK